METLQKTNFSIFREIVNFCNENKIDPREFFENTTLENYQNVIDSIKENYIKFDRFLSNDYLKDDNYFYDYDDYVITREGDIVYTDDAYFCEYFEEYTREEVQRVYIGRGEQWYSERGIERAGLWEYRNDYYDADALERNDLVIMHDGEVMDINDVYYSENSGQYEYEPDEEEDREEYIESYHAGTSHVHTFTEDPRFFIGYEIEKEDREVKESIYIDQFKRECDGWRKERDGSLNDSSGYELISPTFELNVDKIKEVIDSNDTLKAHINAKKSDSCGGHINISENGLSGLQLFEQIEGYTPLIHALYYKRMNKTYSKGKANKDLKEGTEKFQSVRIHTNRIEYRIVSAVPNFTTLMWRTRLFDFILNNKTNCVKEAYFNFVTKLRPLIEEMYCTSEKFAELNKRVIEMTQTYEGINLSDSNN